MAALPSGDRSVNGALDRQQADSLETGALGEDQTRADREQTLADTDQTSSDGDQTASDRDQTASDRDQIASDRDLAHGGAVDVHDLTRDLRDRSAAERRHSARERVAVAASRDAAAHDRDMAALARDQIAALQDRELAARDALRADDHGRAFTGRDIVLRAADQRRRAAMDRQTAAEARARAATDREQAAHDREQAARDRLQAQADREALLAQLAVAETDPLTGARTRRSGLADLDHEVERAQRTTGVLSVAYVDVVGLKAVNDSQGHAAGDALLKSVVAVIREHLRPYDLIVRLGGDEFLCAMSNMPLPETRERLNQVTAALAGTPHARAIRTGFADVTPGENASDLIARADRALLDTGSRSDDPPATPALAPIDHTVDTRGVTR